MNSVTNKNAFKWDAYRRLLTVSQHALGRGVCIPACTGWGCLPGLCLPWGGLPRVVSALGVSAQGGGVCPGRGCLPRGIYPGRGCLPGGCLPECVCVCGGGGVLLPRNQRQTTPCGQTDSCENNLRKLRLRAVKIKRSKEFDWVTSRKASQHLTTQLLGHT